jgi:hypothetical protein
MATAAKIEFSATDFFSRCIAVVLTASVISLDYSRRRAIRQTASCPHDFARNVVRFSASTFSAVGGTIPEDYHFMLRFTTLVLAISCAITCTMYGQQPSTQQPAAPPPNAASAPPGATAPAATPAPPAPNVPEDAPVITLKGACEVQPPAAPPQGCVNSLTRAQFEKLTNALQPAEKGPVPPEVRRRFATQYAKLLTLADAARALGLENDPKVLEIFTFAKNQILAEAINQHFREEFAHPSEQKIQQYYDENKNKYREVTLQRIIIPVNQGGADKPKPSEEEQRAYADKMRQRWVAGEDASKLQKEAMEHSGVTTSVPDVNVGARRPGSLPQAHEAVFELKDGGVSQPFSDNATVYIYKVLTVRQVPVSEVKASIEQTLQNQLFTEKLQQLQSAVTPELNEAYFGPEPPPQPARNMMRPGMPGMPGAGAPPRGPGVGPGAPPPPPPSSGAPPSAGSTPPTGDPGTTPK